MKNRFEVSSNFTIKRERTARNIETVTAPDYNLIHEMAAFIAAMIAAILAGGSTGVLLNTG